LFFTVSRAAREPEFSDRPSDPLSSLSKEETAAQDFVKNELFCETMLSLAWGRVTHPRCWA
jgi:hypothetical protein